MGISALYPTGNWTFTGSVGYLYVKEKLDNFTERAPVLARGFLFNPSRKVRLGQGRAGIGVSYCWRSWEPFANAFFVHDFTRTEVGVGAGQPRPSEDDNEVRLGGGLRYFDEAHGVTASVEFISVAGREDIESESVNLTLRLEL